MDDVFDWFGKLFSPTAGVQKIFTGSETHIIIVMNDDTNSMEYVVDRFGNILNIPQEKALNIVLRIHNEGIAVVWAGSASEAEHHLSSLREAGLNSYMISTT